MRLRILPTRKMTTDRQTDGQTDLVTSSLLELLIAAENILLLYFGTKIGLRKVEGGEELSLVNLQYQAEPRIQ